MITPPYLVPGDKIGIVAPARSVEVSEIEKCISFFEQYGIEALSGKNLFGKRNQFSGTDAERADDINFFLKQGQTKAILCARGGYGSIRTAMAIDWELLKNSPQWVVGYSDVTVLHSFVHNIGIKSLHAPMAFNIAKPDFDNDSKIHTVNCLMGKNQSYNIPPHALNVQGKAKGRLIGGNLSVLYSMRGTPADISTKGKILFIEDIDEYLYHIDRMMMNLKIGGLLDGLHGIVVGGMTDMKDNNMPFGKNAYEIILEHTCELGVPVLFNFPAGHNGINFPLVMGHDVVLEVGKTCSLSFNA